MPPWKYNNSRLQRGGGGGGGGITVNEYGISALGELI